MSMLKLIARLEKLYDVSIRRVLVNDNIGPCSYDWSTDTIVISRGARNEQEQAFCALHEFRHALQVRSNMFPKLKTLTLADLPNDDTYWELPWEVDANEWALKTGVEMGLFNEDFRPFWLKPGAMKGWKEYNKVA